MMCNSKDRLMSVAQQYCVHNSQLKCIEIEHKEAALCATINKTGKTRNPK